MVDIANHAGVALSTVSYALSGKRSVSAETRGRIQQAIKELGFQPHAPARALASRSSRTISLFYPASRDDLQLESHIFLTGVAEATSDADYSLLVSNAAEDPDDIAATLESGRADGVILMEVRMEDERVERLRIGEHAFSLIGRCRDNDGFSFVDFDFEDAVGSALDHLAELGHRHVALINRVPGLAGSDYGPTIRSRAAFEEGLSLRSLEGADIVLGSSTDSYAQVRRFLESKPGCTAAITLSVTFAPLLAALRDLELHVPRDFSVVSIVAPQVAELVTPPLTTVDLPAYEMGRLGAEILIRRLANSADPPSQLVLRGQLQVRSSGPPPRKPPRRARVMVDNTARLSTTTRSWRQIGRASCRERV
jgi:Transcriptional regulators